MQFDEIISLKAHVHLKCMLADTIDCTVLAFVMKYVIGENKQLLSALSFQFFFGLPIIFCRIYTMLCRLLVLMKTHID